MNAETHERNIAELWEMIAEIIKVMRNNGLDMGSVNTAKYDPEQTKLKVMDAAK